MKNKRGISLITLAITILVMAILTTVIVMTTNNSGIIKNSKTTVSKTNLQQVQEMAQIAWANAQIDGKETTEELTEAVKASLTASGIDVSKYSIKVTENGVAVAEAVLQNNLITFTLEGISYQAEDGMTWEDWLDSEYNVKGFYIYSSKILVRTELYIGTDPATAPRFSRPTDIIEDGRSYDLLWSED